MGCLEYWGFRAGRQRVPLFPNGLHQHGDGEADSGAEQGAAGQPAQPCQQQLLLCQGGGVQVELFLKISRKLVH